MPVTRPAAYAWQWRLAALSPLLALLVTRPWHPGAFPVWDFADMLPILREAAGPRDAFAGLAAFTRLEGRANYLTYFQIAATWQIAGDNPVWWQWQRALLMLLVGGLFVLTVRRFGGTPLAAGTGALVLLLSKPGTEGWLYLSGEPLAAALLLVLILAGRSSPTSGRLAVLLLAALAAMAAKEVVAVLLPVALCLALFRDDGDSGRPRWSLRDLTHLASGLAAVLALESFSAVSALRDAQVDAYASQFRLDIDRLSRAPQLFRAMLLPVQTATPSWTGVAYPANLIFLTLLASAGVLWWRRHATSDRARGGALGLSLLAAPMIGAMTYAFWPRYSAFYGIPFALGGAGLAAAALTILATGRRARTGTLIVAATLMVGFIALDGARTVAQRRAFADLAMVAASQITADPSLDTVLVVKAGPGGNRWPVTGPELERYAAAVSRAPRHVPTIRDATCQDVAARLQQPLRGVGVLNDQNACGPLSAATFRFLASADYLDWLSLKVRPDTMTLDLLVAPGDRP